MKQCPTCRKTYEDSMRFCQIDGTTLVEESEADPLKTIVGGAPITDKEEDLLQLPADADDTKTLISQSNNFGSDDAAKKSDLNPLSGDFLNQPPAFDNSPNTATAPPFDQTLPNYQPPSFKEPEQTNLSEPDFGASPQSPFNQSPFDQSQNPFGQPMQQSSWTPPPAPEANWQNQNIGANTPFQPPVSQGQDKTLAIVALVCGILSLTCCGPVTGIAALITGYMAKNNVDANPQQYDGRGMALAGMIMGGISLVLTVLYFIFIGFVGFLR